MPGEHYIKIFESYNLMVNQQAAQSLNTDQLPNGEKQPSISDGVVASLRNIFRSFFEENAAFKFTCIYLIIEYNKPQATYPLLDIIPWGKTILFIAIISSFLETKRNVQLRLATMIPLIAFSGIVLLSMGWAFSPSVAFGEWIVFFNWFFVIFLIVKVVDTPRKLFLFLVVYFLANLKMAQHGFITWAMRGFGAGWGVTGSPGWFANPGEFSMEMAVFLPLLLSYIVFFRSEWKFTVKLLLYLFVIMAIGSIIASNSRSGVLGLALVGIWGVLSSRKRIRVLIILFIIAGAIYISIPPEFLARFETAGEDKTSLTRLVYWKYGVQAVKDNPVLGVGYRNWSAWAAIHHPDLVGAKGWGETVEVIHNTYLEVATELGLLGAVGFSAILIQISVINRNTIKVARKCGDRFLEATGIGLVGSLIAFLGPSYFMSVLYYPYIWILLALSVCASNICQERIKMDLLVPARK